MYTQCPECDVAFRVTADVLKQAAGKVRCGGCGVAFNALNHLSEDKPAPATKATPVSESRVPELQPEEPGELEADTPPETISAAQSAALLKTLDQLAGSDIRIEDTGVEWRVLDVDEDEDEDEANTGSDDVEEPAELIGDTGSLRFIIEGDDDDDLTTELDDESLHVIDEMRFDDNTPLPDDFDFRIEPPPTPVVTPPPPIPEDEPMAMREQVDLALGDPDEWQDLLGDLDETSDGQPDSPTEEAAADGEFAENVDDPAETSHDDLVMLADGDAGTPADEPLDMDTQFAIQAEAMGIDLSGMHKTQQAPDEQFAEESAIEAADEDEAPETSIEDDLLAAAFEAEAALPTSDAAISIADAPHLDEEDEEVREEDLDTVGETESGGAEPEPDDDEELDAPTEAESEEDEDVEDIEIDLDAYVLEDEDAEDDIEDIEDIALPFDDEVEGIIETIAASLDDEPEPDDEEPEGQVAGGGDEINDEPIIPEMTEEEKTINMMIDQELLAIAVEDDDGFASTIVQKQPDKKVEAELDINKPDNGRKSKAEPLFETIIMEGESIRGDLDKERLAADRAARSGNYGGPGVSLPFKKDNEKASDRREYNPPAAGTYIGIVALGLLLILQVVHQSREALATVPAFNNTIGPIYRLLGSPLTPTWDISGWRFEATKGSTESAGAVAEPGETSDTAAANDNREVLTVYSRVGNQSEAALPYPLLHLSLTDRFEEIVGTTVLEPSEYLAENADPRKLVPPGNTFNAVISIASPSASATGFKLNVCYRLANGQLRCAIEDFK